MSNPKVRPDKLSMEGMIWNGTLSLSCCLVPISAFISLCLELSLISFELSLCGFQYAIEINLTYAICFCFLSPPLPHDIKTADHVLEQALDPKTNGIPKAWFQKSVGLLLISVVEAGFVFSGNVGTGILLGKKEDGTWSKPCAMGLGGVGWGFLVGAAMKDIIVFIFDKNSLAAMSAESGLRMGGQLNLTVGPFGRNYEGAIGVSGSGGAATTSVAFSKGAFLSLSIEGAVLQVRHGANDQFYKKATSAAGILQLDDVEMPEDRPTLIQNVYDKLEKLSEGTTSVPTPEEIEEKEKAAESAQKASDEVAEKEKDSVVKISSIEEEAKKEAEGAGPSTDETAE